MFICAIGGIECEKSFCVCVYVCVWAIPFHMHVHIMQFHPSIQPTNPQTEQTTTQVDNNNHMLQMPILHLFNPFSHKMEQTHKSARTTTHLLLTSVCTYPSEENAYKICRASIVRSNRMLWIRQWLLFVVIGFWNNSCQSVRLRLKYYQHKMSCGGVSTNICNI